MCYVAKCSFICYMSRPNQKNQRSTSTPQPYPYPYPYPLPCVYSTPLPSRPRFFWFRSTYTSALANRLDVRTTAPGLPFACVLGPSCPGPGLDLVIFFAPQLLRALRCVYTQHFISYAIHHTPYCRVYLYTTFPSSTHIISHKLYPYNHNTQHDA